MNSSLKWKKNKKNHYKSASKIFTLALKRFVNDAINLKFVKTIRHKEMGIDVLTERTNRYYLYQNVLFSNTGKEIIRNLDSQNKQVFNVKFLNIMLTQFFKKCKKINKIPTSGYLLVGTDTKDINQKSICTNIRNSNNYGTFESDYLDLIRLIWYNLLERDLNFGNDNVDSIFEIIKRVVKFIIYRKLSPDVNQEVNIEEKSWLELVDRHDRYLFQKHHLQWKLFQIYYYCPSSNGANEISSINLTRV